MWSCEHVLYIVHALAFNILDALNYVLNVFLDSQPLSPLSVHERYNSPAAGSAKRRLFGDDGPKESPVERLHTTPEITRIRIIPSQPPEQLCMSPDKILSGQKLSIPLAGKYFKTMLGQCYMAFHVSL